MQRIVDYARKSFRALKADSVIKVYDILERFSKLENAGYLGVKDTAIIDFKMLSALEKIGYLTHTIDKSSGGRAIDLQLKNPITANQMTGSSSGSAINVFLEINDVAIATDGGGSVLAPALSLNLYGMISPLFFSESIQKYRKVSTDGIEFVASIGFIAKDIQHINRIANHLLKLDDTKSLQLRYAKNPNTKIIDLNIQSERIELSYNNSSRENLMQDLKSFDFENYILCCEEGPVDYFSYGDTIMGHYDATTKLHQMQGHKYYLTVVNMLGLSAIVIPSENLSSGYLLVCKSDKKHILAMLNIANQIKFKRSTIENNYFSIRGGY